MSRLKDPGESWPSRETARGASTQNEGERLDHLHNK